MPIHAVEILADSAVYGAVITLLLARKSRYICTIAVDFVSQMKLGQKIEVASVEPKNGGWMVKGSSSMSTPTSYSSERP